MSRAAVAVLRHWPTHRHGMLSGWAFRQLIGGFLRSLGWMAARVLAGDVPGVALLVGVLGAGALWLFAVVGHYRRGGRP